MRSRVRQAGGALRARTYRWVLARWKHRVLQHGLERRDGHRRTEDDRQRGDRVGKLVDGLHLV